MQAEGKVERKKWWLLGTGGTWQEPRSAGQRDPIHVQVDDWLWKGKERKQRRRWGKKWGNHIQGPLEGSMPIGRLL